MNTETLEDTQTSEKIQDTEESLPSFEEKTESIVPTITSGLIARVAKRSLQQQFKIGKDAKETLSKAVSIFILYITHT